MSLDPRLPAVLPTYFISHGGGPWPWMMKDMGGAYDQLAASLKDTAQQIGGKPKAILVISGHWEEREFTVQASAEPPMIYDYGGFPAHTYQIKYPAPGRPALAKRVQSLLVAAGFKTDLDGERGYDHGTFSPLAVMYPAADVPVVQLSMKQGYDPKTHFEVGRALAPLRREGVLIIGSGLSYHNLRARGAEAVVPSREFDAWLSAALATVDPAQRAAKIFDWASAPSARQAHPREDHLIPLMVALGAAAEDEATRIYHEDSFMGGWTVSSFRFG